MDPVFLRPSFYNSSTRERRSSQTSRSTSLTSVTESESMVPFRYVDGESNCLEGYLSNRRLSWRYLDTLPCEDPVVNSHMRQCSR
uniref:Uncharacterized protein n=2 Tax=Tetraselmis sp. GSL018 TaxID=582737 RepID=A0A061S6Q8_9CHLO